VVGSGNQRPPTEAAISALFGKIRYKPAVPDGAKQPNHERRDRDIAGLVAQALDDLETGQLDVEAVLGLVAQLAWDAGYRAGTEDRRWNH
jgi:hypothetical protein